MTEPTPTVYSYYAPEIRNTVTMALHRLNGSLGVESIHDTLKKNYDPGLDDLHLPLMEKYEAFARSEGVIGLEGFDEKYFTNGSSEALFHIISGLLPTEPLYQFDGEYQGYSAYAEAIGRPIYTVNAGDATAERPGLNNVAPGIVILSNPASKDGNIIDPNLLTTILRRHKVIIDLAYMGMTQKPLNIDMTQPGIVAVVGSLSKPFGMYYYRIGFCYTKYPIASLYGNRWFKNALSIKLGAAVLDHFDPKKLQAFRNKYFNLQQEAALRATEFLGRTMTPSDVWLLAHGGPYLGSITKVNPFKRGSGEDFTVRACLTPYYMEWENA